MKAFLEVWLRGFAKDRLKELSERPDGYHPHVTLVRPFEFPDSDQEKIKQKIVETCRGQDPIPFSLQGAGSFLSSFYYIPVTNEQSLLDFSNKLERSLEGLVTFEPKLSEKKQLHSTIKSNERQEHAIDQYMLRLTAISKKKIWFSYDLVTQQVLTRDQSRDNSLWFATVHEFTKKSGLLPTRNGYHRIS